MSWARMESCPGSQWLALKLEAMGHTARIIPAQFVKPYVKSNKNDMVDAEAIAEAVTRPTMRFVQVRHPEQIARQALHGVRDRYMSQRTGLINQMPCFRQTSTTVSPDSASRNTRRISSSL
jgi:transposase